MRILKFLTVPLLLCLFTLTTGCATDQAVISQAAQMNTQLQPAVMQDPQLTNYFQQVGDRIIAAAKELDKQGYGPPSHKKGNNDWMFGQDMKFFLVNSKTVNAFTTGGNFMYVYNALFQMCKNEDELAAVMSHEYGHVYARHVAKGMNRQMIATAAALGLGGAGYLLGGQQHGQEYAALGTAAGAAGGQFLNMGFTREDEAQADELGFAFYTHAGWDPTRFAEFFQDMIDAGYDKTPAVASDHPTLASRVEAANERVKELPPEAKSWRKPPVADDAQFKALQARAAQLAKTLPDDSSLQNSQQLLQALPRSCIVPYTAKDEVQARQELQQKVAKKKKKAKSAGK
jgi:predicted Zn-dependent protease